MTDFSGTYTGSNGSNNPSGDGGDGGVGLSISIFDIHRITASGNVLGGEGGGSYGGTGGTGGWGLDFSGQLLTNYGAIYGGQGGDSLVGGGIGGDGGGGVHVDGILGSSVANNSLIVGGEGGDGAVQGGTGGVGVQIDAGGEFSNVGGGLVSGGYGGYSAAGVGGQGGVGVIFSSGASFFPSQGQIFGGDGGFGANGGGDGGTGVQAEGFTTFSNYSNIYGGDGASEGNPNSIFAGAGGIGVSLASGATMTNEGLIQGGDGAFDTIIGSRGGVGVYVSGGASFINNQTVTGGYGGFGVTLAGGPGGAGVFVAEGGSFTNTGSVSGGDGANSPSATFGGNGGTGVIVYNGTLINEGLISGGMGGVGSTLEDNQGDAVRFTGEDESRLIVGVFGSFDGEVKAQTSSDNTIELRDGPGTGNFDFGNASGFDRVQLNAGAEWFGTGAIASDLEVQLLGSSTFLSDDLDGFDGTVEGFDTGDLLGFRGVDVTDFQGSSFDYGTGVLTIDLGSDGIFTLNFAEPLSFTNLFFNVTTDMSFSLDITLSTMPCYCPGTLILTARGEVPVEQLAIGDRVVTVSGALEPIKWIGRSSYAGRFIADSKHLLPVRIRAGALGNGLPRRDLVISPAHAMYLDGMLVPAGALVNGCDIVREQIKQVEYIHIETNAHEVIWAEGAASETYIDCNNRGAFHNADDYTRRYPDAGHAAPQQCAPRLSEGYALEAIRRRIAQGAALCIAA